MLSILIPIYNYNCVKLVQELQIQSSKESIDFEIICMDDASFLFKDENRKVNSIDKCSYIELERNIGRSKIRNLLAGKATYDYLLFLDCDVEIASSHYIKTYLSILNNYEIISGKRIYTNLPPDDKNYYFHWFYGVNREVKSPNFMSNNFLMKKDIWEKVKFDENITRYGHEDTLFQIQLEEKGIQIHFIDNPVIHIGLDSNEAFVRKHNEGIENLLYIFKNRILANQYLYRFRLLEIYQKICRCNLNKIIGSLFPFMQKVFIKNFTGKRPNLYLFDIYKLIYISYIDKK